MEASRSTRRATPVTTAEMRRRPPGDPTTAHGSPSRSRIAGAAAWSARRPGAGEIRRPGRGSNHIIPLFRGYPSPGTAKADPKRPPRVPVSATAMPSASIALTWVVQSEVGAPDGGGARPSGSPGRRGLCRRVQTRGPSGVTPAAARGGSRGPADPGSGTGTLSGSPRCGSGPRTPAAATPRPGGGTGPPRPRRHREARRRKGVQVGERRRQRGPPGVAGQGRHRVTSRNPKSSGGTSRTAAASKSDSERMPPASFTAASTRRAMGPR